MGQMGRERGKVEVVYKASPNARANDLSQSYAPVSTSAGLAKGRTERSAGGGSLRSTVVSAHCLTWCLHVPDH